MFDLPEIAFKKQAKEAVIEPLCIASLFGEEPSVHFS